MIDIINTTASQWSAVFLTAVIQNTLFLGLLFLALHTIRKSTARIKYLIMMIGLIKLLFLPVFPITVFSPSSVSPQIATFTRIAPLSVSPQTLGQQGGPTLQAFSILFLIWIVGAAAYLIFSLIATCRLHLSLKNAEYVCDTEDNIPIYFSRHPIPFSLGLWKKRIYLPATLYNSDKDSMQYIIKHETAHIKRKDHLIQIIQTLVQALYLFHPLVWFLNKRIDEYREMACDDLSAGKEYDSRIAYSKILIEIAEGLSKNADMYPATAILKRRNELLKRIKYQIKEKIMTKKQKLGTGLITSVLIILAVTLSWNCTQEDIDKSQPFSPDQNIEALENVDILDENATIQFIPHDEPPKPVDGYVAIQKQLHYPEIAQKAGIEGKVLIWAFVDKTGKITKAKIKKGIGSGDSSCEKAALAAISNTEWEPATAKDEPLGVWVMVPIEFKLNDNKPDKQIPPPLLPPSEFESDDQKTESGNEDNPKFIPYDEPPKPIGGYNAIMENLHYPEIAQKAGIEGKVLIWSFVDKTGKVTKTQVKEGIDNSNDSGCEEAAIEAIKKVKWEPATRYDKSLGVWILIPVEFALQ